MRFHHESASLPPLLHSHDRLNGFVFARHTRLLLDEPPLHSFALQAALALFFGAYYSESLPVHSTVKRVESKATGDPGIPELRHRLSLELN